jgi:hypothetical protein
MNRIAHAGLLILFTLMFLAACSEGGGGKAGEEVIPETPDEGEVVPPQTEGAPTPAPSPTPVNNTRATFTLTAVDQEGASSGATGLNDLSKFLNGDLLQTTKGTILAVNLDTGATRTFTFEVEVDTTAIQFTAEFAFPLAPGFYDFFALFVAPNGRAYGSLVHDHGIVQTKEGLQNIVRFEVQPVLGAPVTDVAALKDLVQFQFQFDLLGNPQFINPSVGISIDRAPERRFTINQTANWSQVLLALLPGVYRVQISLYDQNNLVGIPLDIDIEIKTDTDVIVVPIQVVSTFSPDPAQKSSVFNLVIPGFVVEETGGLNATGAVFSLYDKQIKLFEQVVQLIQAGQNYEATVVVPGFWEGTITWTLYLSDLTKNPPQVVAYCAQDITLSPTGQQSLLCNVRLLERSDPVEEQQPKLTVTAQLDGAPLPGAVITANGRAVGITGGGTVGTIAGVLETFLPAGKYSIGAAAPEPNSTLVESKLEQVVTLQAGQSYQLLFQFKRADTTPPVVTITQPKGLTNDPTPLLSYTSNEPGAERVWLIWPDGTRTEEPTRSGQRLARLSEGAFTVTVEVTDAAGNKGSASSAFTVDLTAPSVSITSPVNGSSTNDNTPTLTFVSSEAGVANVSIDGVPQFSVNVSAGVSFSRDVGPLVDGNHTIEVVVSDAAGNATTASTAFNVKTVPPLVTITQPSGVINNPEPLLSYTSTEPGTVRVWLVWPNGTQTEEPTRSGQTFRPLPEGDFKVIVQVTTAAGNVGSADSPFTIDLTAPSVSISAPVDGSLTNDNTPTLTFLSSELGFAVVTIDGASEFSVDVNGGLPYSRELRQLQDGAHKIGVVVTDAAGNAGTASTAFTIDTLPPKVTILSPVGTITEREPIFEFSSSEPAKEVKVFVDGNPVSTLNGERLPRQDDGDHVLTVQATDAAGNVGSASVTFTVRTPPPVNAIQLDAQYFRRPTRRVDGEVNLDQALRILIPDHKAIQVLAGNPERFVLYLRLGHVHCVYLAGSYNAHVGGVELNDLEWFRRFQSPVCGLGRFHAGDEITIKGSIRARILFGDPKYEETHLRLFIDVLGLGDESQITKKGGKGKIKFDDDDDDDDED